MSGADARVSERLNHLQTTREGDFKPLDAAQPPVRDTPASAAAPSTSGLPQVGRAP
jgi:hypothetical protein